MPNNDGCAEKIFEDNLRPSDSGRIVVYDAPRTVYVGLSRITPHSGFAPGWSTTIINKGQGNVVIAAHYRDSRINGSTSPFTIPAGQLALIVSESVNNYLAIDLGHGHTPSISGSDDREDGQ